MTTRTQESVEVDLPVGEVYQLWTEFENFPHFMSNVDEVHVTSPGQLHWKASILGVEREWDAEVVDQIPNSRISWRSITGSDTAGEVSFEPLSASKTKVNLDLSFEPEGFTENVGDKLGIVANSAEADLGRFKDYVQEHYAKDAPSEGLRADGLRPPDSSAAPLGGNAGILPGAAAETPGY